MMNLSKVNQIRNFMLIWRDTGFCLLNIPYANPVKVDSDMLAELFRAIQQVVSDDIKRMIWNHQTILFEFDKDLLYVLIMHSVSDETSYRNALIKVRNRVSRRFQERREWSKLIKTGQVSRFLKEMGVADYIVDAIIDGLQNESEENRMEIIAAALDSPLDFEMLSWNLKTRNECRQWLVKVLKIAKVPTEAINSIIIGLERNLEPAKKEVTRILSKQGVSSGVIEWLITEIRTPDDE
ncbi:hypothetical protein ES708_28347 [subsurface metagenome]